MRRRRALAHRRPPRHKSVCLSVCPFFVCGHYCLVAVSRVFADHGPAAGVVAVDIGLRFLASMSLFCVFSLDVSPALHHRLGDRRFTSCTSFVAAGDEYDGRVCERRHAHVDDAQRYRFHSWRRLHGFLFKVLFVVCLFRNSDVCVADEFIGYEQVLRLLGFIRFVCVIVLMSSCVIVVRVRTEAARRAPRNRYCCHHSCTNECSALVSVPRFH